MKAGFFLLLFGLLSGCGGSTRVFIDPAPTPLSLTATVLIPVNAHVLASQAFGSSPLNIRVGTTVKWINTDTTPHIVISNDLSWTSPTLQPGDAFSKVFSDSGTINYHCAIDATMTGQIIVSKLLKSN